jgi:tetratricopeptide (TPR) repeat protein
MKSKCLAIASLLALAACAPMPARIPSAAVPDEPVRQPALPGQELSGQIFYEYLLGEIAMQRGEPNLAAEALLDLARSTRDPRIAQRASEAALHTQRVDLALEAAALWLELDPDSMPATQTMAVLLVNSGRLAEAKPYLAKLIAGGKEIQARDFLQLDQLLARQSDKAAALEMVQGLAQPYPQSPEAHFAVAQAAWAAEKFDLALAEAREAGRLHPGWEIAALVEGQLLQRDSAAKALEFYQAFLRDYPRAKDVRLAYAKLLATEKQYGPARTQFQQLSGDFPGNPEVSMAIGLLALQQGDLDSAETYLKQTLNYRYRDENLVRLYLGQLGEERQRLEEAATWYLSVGEGEHYFDARIRHAAVLAKQGQLGEARARLQQLSPQNNQQRVQLALAEAQLLREARAYQDAYEVLSRALEKLPNHPDLLYGRAMAAETVGKLDVLEQDLRKLIQLKPDNAQAYNALGYSFADHSIRLEEARELIEKALKLSPDDPFVMDSLGWVHYRLGQYAKAVEYLRRALGLRSDPEIAAHLGEVLWVQGERGEAEKVWQSALKEFPKSEALLNAVKKFKP